jgi:uncharacterized protein (DUF1697 family)
MVVLLRGVNVGGTTTLPMADLRAIATDLGYEDVATYIQSGNLVLSTPRAAATVVTELEAALAERSGPSPSVLVRTRRQLARVAAGNPFLADDADPTHLHVMFCRGPASKVAGGVDVGSFAPEEARAIGNELYLHLPNGMGRSKLAVALGKRKDGVGTVRNWRTVGKVLALAEKID